MKYISLSILIVFFSLQGSAKDVTITGQVKDAVPVKIYLSLQKGNKLTAIDSVLLDAKGNFKFLLKEGYKQGIYKLQMDKFTPAPVIIGNEEKITIAADYETLKNGELRIIASKENDAYAVLSNFFTIYNKGIDSLQHLLDGIPRFDPQHETKTKKIKESYSVAIIRFNNSVRLVPGMFPGTIAADVLVPLYLVPERTEFKNGKDYDTDEAFEHAHFFDYINFTDARIINTATYEMKLFTYLDQFVDHNEAGFKKGVDIIMAGASKNAEVRDFTVAYLLEVFTVKGPTQLVEYVHDSYSEGCELLIKSETEKILNKLKQVSIGTAAPELAINDINYTPVSLKNTLKGKIGMVYFWASTCSHCMDHTPKVYETYKKYKSKGFEVYSVSLDSDYSAWLKAIQDMRLDWINVSELNGWNSSAINTYALERTPTIFLIDREGKILDKNFSPDLLEDKLKVYLR